MAGDRWVMGIGDVVSFWTAGTPAVVLTGTITQIDNTTATIQVGNEAPQVVSLSAIEVQPIVERVIASAFALPPEVISFSLSGSTKRD